MTTQTVRPLLLAAAAGFIVGVALIAQELWAALHG